jgi:hypothetical protein
MIYFNNHRRMARSVLVLALILTLPSCATKVALLTSEQANVDLAYLLRLPEEPISYEDKVRPILQNRCVVCHGCYDAPCQLKLSSPAGIARGASKERVYLGSRFKTMSPTRLGIDAVTTEDWRKKNFHTVLSEDQQDPKENLQQSVVYRMLRMKQLTPQPRTGMLPDSIDLGLGREQSCPTINEFDDYQEEFPLQGMPFAMPNLSEDEYQILTQWIAQGAPLSDDKSPSIEAKAQISRWESFFNTPDLKSQLVSRYIYEHLFQGHLHFQGTGNREFYRLIRSSTASGEPAVEIPTLRPYNKTPGAFSYRLQRYQADIVAKNHVVYELSDQRLQRFKELFLIPDYPVTQLPSWESEIAANPFKAFAEIPPRSRYLFLLDDARFFIEGFIKGPVCRGMIALNVIEDHFWVAFINPQKDPALSNTEFLSKLSDYLQLPTVQEDDIKLIGSWRKYRKLEQAYVSQRFKMHQTKNTITLDQAMDLIWDGPGQNRNAALTVFRHFDSASVSYGFVGDYPETAWIIDYPTLERIHYLLVAGFNVFGNLKHQLHTRLYMDFLRMESEDLFLAFLPSTHRKGIRDQWYSGMRDGMGEDLSLLDDWMDRDIVTGYQTPDPQRELFQRLEHRLSIGRDEINRCSDMDCVWTWRDEKKRTDIAMRKIAAIKGRLMVAFPDLAFIRVVRGGNVNDDYAYTIVRNKAYKNVTSIFSNEDDSENRDYSHDSLTILDRLEGSYPNFFFEVSIEEVDEFAQAFADLKDRQDYEALVGLYGLRRTNSNFWETADWFQSKYRNQNPLAAGIFDLNRYQNR